MNREEERAALEADNVCSTESVPPENHARTFQERPPEVMEVPPEDLRRWSRRDLLLFGVGAIAAAAGGGALLPQTTLRRLGIIDGNKS